MIESIRKHLNFVVNHASQVEELKGLLKGWSLSAKHTHKEELNLTTDEEIDRLVEAADKNRSGDIDGTEFLELVRIRKVEVHKAAAGKPHLPHGFSHVFGDERPATFIETVVASVYFESFTIGIIIVNMVIMCTRHYTPS